MGATKGLTFCNTNANTFTILIQFDMNSDASYELKPNTSVGTDMIKNKTNTENTTQIRQYKYKGREIRWRAQEPRFCPCWAINSNLKSTVSWLGLYETTKNREEICKHANQFQPQVSGQLWLYETREKKPRKEMCKHTNQFQPPCCFKSVVSGWGHNKNTEAPI